MDNTDKEAATTKPTLKEKARLRPKQCYRVLIHPASDAVFKISAERELLIPESESFKSSISNIFQCFKMIIF